MPDGNFQDYVGLSQDTLYHKGAQLDLGTSTATTVGIGMQNSAGAYSLEVVGTGNATAFLPPGGGTLAVATQIGITALSAGTQLATSGAVVFANSNGITFGMSGSSQVTASVAAAPVNFSAGTTSNNLANVVFSNSNGVSFGLNGSTITASAAGGAGGVAIAAGTQTGSTGTVVFSQSNSIAFGMSNSSVVTASIIPGNVIISNLAVFASEFAIGNGGSASNVNWNNGNEQSITLNSATCALTFTPPAFMGGATAHVQLRIVQDGSGGRLVTWPNAILSGLPIIKWIGGLGPPVLSTAAGAEDIVNLFYNGTDYYGSWGTNFSTTGSPVTVLTNINVSAGTTSNNLSAITFSNSNGVSFGLNGSTVTASVNSYEFSNSNGITFGTGAPFGPGIVVVTASVATSLTAINLSAGTTSHNLSAATFGNSNNISFGFATYYHWTDHR